MKSKVDRLDVDKLVHVLVGVSKLSNVVKIDFVKKDVYNAMIKNIEEKIPAITSLVTNTTLKDEINEVQNEIPSIINVARTAALDAKINYIKRKYLILLT